MAKAKVQKLSEVVDTTVPQGFNDGRWFLLEHQLYQAQTSLQTVRSLCERIGDYPENQDEWELARSALEIVSPVYVDLLGALAATKALLAQSEVAERVGEKEL